MSRDLSGGANPRLERLSEEHEPETEHEADDEAERGIPDRLRLRQGGSVSLSQDRCDGRLKRLHRLERLLTVDQARVKRTVGRDRSERGGLSALLEGGTCAVETLDPLVDIPKRALDLVPV